MKLVFTSRKLSQTLSVKENKPLIVKTQCVVCTYVNVICVMQIMLGTLPNTYINLQHCHSAIGKHLQTQHGNNGTKTDHLFKVLKKCNSKFDCLVYEMLYIKDIKPSLNTQADSIRAKLFTWHYRTFYFLLLFFLFFFTLGIIPIGSANIYCIFIYSFYTLHFFTFNLIMA